MKPALLADENVPVPSILALRQAGYMMAVIERSKGARDDEVLALVVTEGRWLVTMDRDYGELIHRQKAQPPECIIYFRWPDSAPAEPGQRLATLLAGDPAWQGRLVVLEAERVRSRPFVRAV